jgi:hypothetical protein
MFPGPNSPIFPIVPPRGLGSPNLGLAYLLAYLLHPFDIVVCSSVI